MKKIKISLIRQILLLCRISLLYVGAYLYFKITGIKLTNESVVFGIIFIFVIDTLPALLVHFQYLIHEVDVDISVNEQTSMLVYRKKKETKEWSLDTITKLESYYSYGAGTGWYSMAEYEFYRITFSDNQEIIVTNIRSPNFEKVIKSHTSLTPEKKMRLICFFPPIGKL